MYQVIFVLSWEPSLFLIPMVSKHFAQGFVLLSLSLLAAALSFLPSFFLDYFSKEFQQRTGSLHRDTKPHNPSSFKKNSNPNFLSRIMLCFGYKSCFITKKPNVGNRALMKVTSSGQSVKF